METTCVKCNCHIETVDFDFDLKHIKVTNEEGSWLIQPMDIEHMESLLDEIKDGACPICDDWEDGNGNAVGSVYPDQEQEECL